MLPDLVNNNSINLKKDALTWLRNKTPVTFDIDAELSKHDYDEARYLDSLHLPQLRQHLFQNLNKCLKTIHTVEGLQN